MTKVDLRTFGLILGCLWSLGVLMLGIVAMAWRRGTGIVNLFAMVYIGYKATFVGSLIGASWAFIDGTVTGILIAWIYNRFVV
jgi:hypothetical protein